MLQSTKHYWDFTDAPRTEYTTENACNSLMLLVDGSFCNRIVLRESNFKSSYPTLLKENLESASKTVGKPNEGTKQDIYLKAAAVELLWEEEKSGSISCIEWHLQIMLILLCVCMMCKYKSWVKPFQLSSPRVCIIKNHSIQYIL